MDVNITPFLLLFRQVWALLYHYQRIHSC